MYRYSPISPCSCGSILKYIFFAWMFSWGDPIITKSESDKGIPWKSRETLKFYINLTVRWTLLFFLWLLLVYFFVFSFQNLHRYYFECSQLWRQPSLTQQLNNTIRDVLISIFQYTFRWSPLALSFTARENMAFQN